MTDSQLRRLAAFPYIRRQISAALGTSRPLSVEIQKGYVRFRLRDPRLFHPGLYATVPVGRRGTLLVIGTPKSAVKKPAELAAFLRKHRGAKYTRRSLVYRLRQAGIIGGARAQAVLIPKARVAAVAARYPGKAAANRNAPRRTTAPKGRRRSARNPLIATLGFNPGRRAAATNPTQAIRIPFRQGQKVSPSALRNWLDSLPAGPMKKTYLAGLNKAMAQYKRFHLGSQPKYFTFNLVPVGASTNVTDIGFGVSEGKEFAAAYQVPRYSKKYEKDVDGRYVHAHAESGVEMTMKSPKKRKNLPERFHTADGKFVGVIPTKRQKITDWYYD